MHDGPYKCNYCGIKFQRKSARILHIRLVHRNEIIQKGQCPYPGCDKYYTNINCALSVKRHLATYHATMLYANYKCRVCSKLFHDKISYKKHITK